MDIEEVPGCSGVRWLRPHQVGLHARAQAGSHARRGLDAFPALVLHDNTMKVHGAAVAHDRAIVDANGTLVACFACPVDASVGVRVGVRVGHGSTTSAASVGRLLPGASFHGSGGGGGGSSNRGSGGDAPGGS